MANADSEEAHYIALLVRAGYQCQFEQYDTGEGRAVRCPTRHLEAGPDGRKRPLLGVGLSGRPPVVFCPEHARGPLSAAREAPIQPPRGAGRNPPPAMPGQTSIFDGI